MNNPIKYKDFSGLISEEEAAEIIKNNAEAIINAGKEFGVNPAIIAACIYTEHVENVDWVDYASDRALYFLDTSIGVGQVRVSTAKLVEDEGIIAKTYSYKIYGNRIVVSREEAIANKLMDDTTSIRYVAAYLKYFQDRWKKVYPDIDGSTAILATLYNQGETKTPHSNPQPSPFGIHARGTYYYMRRLLGLD